MELLDLQADHMCTKEKQSQQQQWETQLWVSYYRYERTHIIVSRMFASEWMILPMVN